MLRSANGSLNLSNRCWASDYKYHISASKLTDLLTVER